MTRRLTIIRFKEFEVLTIGPGIKGEEKQGSADQLERELCASKSAKEKHD